MELNALITTILITAAATALSVLGIYLVRKRVELSVLRSYHEVAGYLLSIIGTLYAVLLGFMVVDAMSKYDRARVLVEEEANNLSNIFILAETMPSEIRAGIRFDSLSYINAVIDDEWQTMREGRPSEKAIDAVRALFMEIVHIEPKTQNQQACFESMLADMQNLASARKLRMITATSGTQPPMLGVLIVGAIITIVFTSFFGLEVVRTQLIMTGLVTITLSLNLCLVVLYGFPFRAGMPLRPTAFIYNKLIIEREAKRAGIDINDIKSAKDMEKFKSLGRVNDNMHNESTTKGTNSPNSNDSANSTSSATSVSGTSSTNNANDPNGVRERKEVHQGASIK